MGVVLRESAALSAAGVLLGIAGTYGVQALLAVTYSPTFAFRDHRFVDRCYGSLIAFVGSICGALYPAWMAARKDPIDALAYE